MIFCQLKQRVRMDQGMMLHLSDVAVVTGADVPPVQIACPDKPGVWIIRAADVAQALSRQLPEETITMLGGDQCYVHRMPKKRDRWQPLRTAAAFLVLMLGSALGLCWFHSDVDMVHAQSRLFTLMTGETLTDERFITIPYVIGVVAGVVIFYALPGRKEITPMEVKLVDYQEDMERARGREVDEQ